MKKVTILSHRSRIADFTVYPVRKNRKALKERGYNVKICYEHSERSIASDILCLSSVIIRKWWSKPEKVFEFINYLKKFCNKLIYFDEFDSTSITHFQLLPHVDLYLKKQLLKDRTLYTKSFYGDRIFTDFYHKEFGICDEATGHQSKPLDLSLSNKVDLLWHLGLGDMAGDILPPRIRRIKRYFPPSYKISFVSPNRERPLDIMFRGTKKYGRNTLSFHRERMFELLNSMPSFKSALNGRVSISLYKEEMSDSKLVISPFGAGEIGVRDFEAWIYGAALMKPSMSHMETWPEVFKPGETYYPINWNFDNLETGINELIEDEKTRIALAINGQETYKNMISAKGMEAFCDWFVKQIEK
jgi:hypothetical protein